MHVLTLTYGTFQQLKITGINHEGWLIPKEWSLMPNQSNDGERCQSLPV